MQDPVFVIGLFVVMGIVFVLLGLPLKYEKVPPNWIYGFRTPKTLSSKEIWYPINRVAGIDMVRSGITIVGSGLLMLGLKNLIGVETALFFLLAVAVFTTLWMLIHGFSVLRRM